MRNVSVGLRIGLAAIALGLVSLGAAQTWIQGFDAAHTGVSPYEFTPPLALVWKFSSDEAIEEARRGPSWLRGAGPGEVGPEMMGPAMGGEMGMAPGAPGEMMGGMPGPGGPAGLPGPGMMGAPGAGGVPGFRATSLPKPLAAPAVAPDRILFAVGQNVYCVDRVTGAKLWNRNIGSTVYGSPAFCEGYFYVADDAGRIHALKAENGSEDWVFRLDKGVRSGITIHENVLYVGCDDNRVYALNLQSRKLNWVYSTGGKVRAAPAVWRDTVFALSQDGYLYALASDSGRQRWRAYLESDLAFAPPVVRREKVYVAVGKKVFAVDAANGNRRWDFAVPAFITGPIAATDDAVFVGTREGAVYCLDAATGRAKWRYPKEGVSQPVQTGVCVCGDSVVTRAGTRSVLTLDAKTGRLIWQYDLPEGPMRLPRSRALALGGRGQLGGGAPEGGAVPGGGPAGPGAGMPGMPGRLGQGLTWTAAEIEMEDVLEAPLAPADNRIYIVGDDCVLYGLEADAPDNVPPRITQAVLEIQGANKVMFAYSVPIDDIEQFPLRLADLVKVPGAPPVYLSVSVVDLGCGVDPDSLSMTMDGKKLDITYEAEKGILWFIYDPKGRGAAPLPNGKHNVVIEAADWRGNRAQVQLSFTVDNSMSPPSVATGARPGFGGPEGPGMMGPGGPAGPGGMMGPGGPGGMMMPPGPMP